LTMTGLSIFVAFVVGTVELVSLLAEQLGAADHRPWSWLAGIDLNTIGIVIVVTFLVTWIGAVTLWKVRRFDERYPAHRTAVTYTVTARATSSGGASAERDASAEGEVSRRRT
ncbi:hypothetical protein AB4212_06655, partial [Streptomyces sp. 2MCAF27]